MFSEHPASFLLYFWFIFFSKYRTASRCFSERPDQQSISSLVLGVTSINSPSAKNCESVIPIPLQIASKVSTEGIAFRLMIFAIVDSDKPLSLDKRYADQPRCDKICLIFVVTHFYNNYTLELNGTIWYDYNVIQFYITAYYV